jgi:hypothetical protein
MTVVRKSARATHAKGFAFSAEERVRLESLTDDLIAEAAASDPDAQLLSSEGLDRMVFERAVRVRLRKSGTR